MAIGSWFPQDHYSGADYYRELERQRQYAEMMTAQDYQRQRVLADQQQGTYIPPQQLDAVQKANADDRFTSNKKLLLLEN